MRDDDVEAIVGIDPRGDVELGVERAQIGLDRRRRHAGGAGRAVEAGADQALNAERRVVDRNRDLAQGEGAADPLQLDAQIEAGAEGELVERPRHHPVRPAAERHVHERAGADVGDRHDAADQAGDLRGLGGGDAGPLEHAGEAVAAAQSGAKVDDRPLRAFGERLDRVGRRHPAAGVAAISERRDGERARFRELGVGQRRGHGAGQRLEARRQRPRCVTQAETGDEAAQPFARADALAEIDDEIEASGAVAEGGGPLAEGGAHDGARGRPPSSASAATPLPAPKWISST